MLERIAGGRTDLVFDLIAEGHPAATRDANGTAVISWCAYHGDVSAVRHLLAHGESLTALGANYDLNGAAFHGHWQLCQFLLDRGADATQALADTGETPLHAALCKANRPVFERIVTLLLESGADPNRATRPGVVTGAFMRDVRTKAETPLHRAAAFGSERSIELLLAAGASREARDMHGDTPLSWASGHLRPPAILRLLCYGDFRIHPGNASTYDHGTGW
jgi:ankyrin repeat protein